jgi:osmotically-inducible protein OsmY
MNDSRGITRSISALVIALSLVACSSGSADRTDTLGGTAPGSVGATATPSADDAEDRVERALDADSTLQGFGLDADDDDGRIVLKGAVSTAALQAQAAQIAAREAAGLTVDNRIRVDAARTGGTRPVDVDEVEDRVEDALEADSTLRGLDIDVDEENGALVLDGNVKTAAQQTAALELATRTAGSVAVTSRIKVQP